MNSYDWACDAPLLIGLQTREESRFESTKHILRLTFCGEMLAEYGRYAVYGLNIGPRRGDPRRAAPCPKTQLDGDKLSLELETSRSPVTAMQYY